MSILDNHAPEPNDTSRALRNAILELPLEKQDAVQEQLFAVVADYEATGEIKPVVHFIKSLAMTARLHRNPAYRKSLDEADEAAMSAPQGFDVDTFFGQMREQLA